MYNIQFSNVHRIRYMHIYGYMVFYAFWRLRFQMQIRRLLPHWWDARTLSFKEYVENMTN